MPAYQRILEVKTRGRGFVDLTGDIERAVSESHVRLGLATVFVQHTSAGLLIQENADPAVLRDLERWLAELAPESERWEHADEGPDDMPAHLRASVLRSSESIPIGEGQLLLGTWQAIYLWEHRTRPHQRRVVVHISGE